MILRALALGLLAIAGLTASASAQTAQSLFAAKPLPSTHAPISIGRSAQGCIAGAVQLPETGPTWQAMRLSRNHHWGNPATIAFIERLSQTATNAGWKGLYIGDVGQARGGPVKGHASHQSGLDVDIWYTPATRLDLTRSDREKLSAINLRSADQRSVNGNYSPAHAYILEAAARDPAVERIFVTAPIKLAMCRTATRRDADWLRKIRPWWGHNDHFHVRLNCPRGAAGCVDGEPLPPGDGCEQAVWWVTEALEPPDPKAKPTPPRPPLRLADLPAQCTQVLNAR